MPHDEAQSAAADRERLEHMLAAARDALAFAQGRRREESDRDAMLRRARIHCIQEIGEAAARTTDAGRSRAPRIPWLKVVGVRHILVHAYFNVELDAIWRVVQEQLPSLVAELETALREWDAPPHTSDSD